MSVRHGYFAPQIIVAVMLLRGGPFALAAESSQSPLLSPAQRAASRDKFGHAPTAEFIKFDPEYPQKHREYTRQLQELQLELARQAAKGRATPCSRQLFLEARWLVYYSAEWEKI